MFLRDFGNFYYIFIAFYGLWLGAVATTFYNRISKNIAIGPGHKPKCNSCGNEILFPYFFPIIGYILSKGKCKNPKCKFKIPIDYLILEIGIALNVLILLTKYKFYTEEFLFGSILTSYLFFIFFSVLRNKSFNNDVVWFGILTSVCFTFSKFFPNYEDLMIRFLLRAVVLIYIDKKNKIMLTREKALITSFALFTTGYFDALFLTSIILMKLFLKILRGKKYINNYLIAKIMLLYSIILHYFLIYQ